jgi:CHASE3 domain sensor protein
LLVKRDELVTDLTNIVYRHTDAMEKMSKIQADSDKQLVDSMQLIKHLEADRDLKAKQLADLEAATQVVVDMIEDNEAGAKTLVEHLCQFPQRITSFVSDTSKQYLAHALGLVKSF